MIESNMKKHNLLSLLLLLLNVCSFAQDGKNFQQLKPTANPAYMILGVAPTDIERPSTPKEFATAIQNAVVDGKVKPNFAMEINPFEMFTKTNKVSYAKKAVNTLMEKNSAMNIFKNFCVSIASSATDTVTLGRLAKGTSAALGFKTILYNGKAAESTKAAIHEMTKSFYEETFYESIQNQLSSNKSYNQTDINLKIDQSAESTIKRIDEDSTLTETDKQLQKDKFIYLQSKLKLHFASPNDQSGESIIKYCDKQIKPLVKEEGLELKKINKKLAFAREGLIWDVSAAYMGHFIDNSWDSLRNAKWAAWTTISYRINADKTMENVALIDFIGIARYTGNNILVDSSNYVDVGAKLQFTFNKISFSGEYVYRQLTHKPQNLKYNYTDRLACNLDYVVSNLITLKASVGRTFDGNSAVYDQPNNKIFAIGGINFSILNGQ